MDIQESKPAPRHWGGLATALIVIAFGVFILLRNFGITLPFAVITVALVFLLNLSWNRWWPLFIVYGGLWMLANNWKHNSGSVSS